MRAARIGAGHRPDAGATGEKAPEIVKNLTRRYTRILRTINEYDNDDVLQIYLTALAHVYDPHSDYMGKSEMENFNISMKLYAITVPQAQMGEPYVVEQAWQ